MSNYSFEHASPPSTLPDDAAMGELDGGGIAPVSDFDFRGFPRTYGANGHPDPFVPSALAELPGNGRSSSSPVLISPSSSWQVVLRNKYQVVLFHPPTNALHVQRLGQFPQLALPRSPSRSRNLLLPPSGDDNGDLMDHHPARPSSRSSSTSATSGVSLEHAPHHTHSANGPTNPTPFPDDPYSPTNGPANCLSRLCPTCRQPLPAEETLLTTGTLDDVGPRYAPLAEKRVVREPVRANRPRRHTISGAAGDERNVEGYAEQQTLEPDALGDDGGGEFVNRNYFRLLEHARTSHESPSFHVIPGHSPSPAPAGRWEEISAEVETEPIEAVTPGDPLTVPYAVTSPRSSPSPPPESHDSSLIWHQSQYAPLHHPFRESPHAKPNGTPGLSPHLFNTGYYHRFFVQLRKLGRGRGGSVHLCDHVLDGEVLGRYAIKLCAVGESHRWLVSVLKEVKMLERLRHPNIIEYKHAWLEQYQLTPFGPPIPVLFILMELANASNLEDYVQMESSDTPRPPRPRRPSRLIASPASDPRPAFWYGGVGIDPSTGRRVRYLTERQIWHLLLDACSGLAHLHACGVVHRDVKPPNLLLHYGPRGIVELGPPAGWAGASGLSMDPDELPRVLLSDFGECEVINLAHVGNDRIHTGATGTLEFCAPEAIVPGGSGGDARSDMWSMGVVLYYMCYARLPWKEYEDVDALRREVEGYGGVSFPDDHSPRPSNLPADLPPRVTPELKRLIRRLMARNPSLRPTARDVLVEFGDRGGWGDRFYAQGGTSRGWM
ncbi:kinase-like protein [Gonapodya prolifera JEL478]|uniref:non-specific serine/threonine protein kinase n=1 Tax=Gonapodya prolifera (strain JEL478) TaxID=1344416 RepID=A0A139AP25_GONPJ|nr:kinase-like protein [Gonapodya prolifera JEL478]|eukprot:KXS18511.1 kinase-like protein [Gonapodya prolifera JEL478]